MRNLTGKVDRQEIQLRVQEDFIQDLQQHNYLQEQQLSQQSGGRGLQHSAVALGNSGVPLAEENRVIAAKNEWL